MNKKMLYMIESRIVSETKSDNVLYIFDNIQELNKYKKQCLEKHYSMYDKIFMTIDDVLHNRLVGYRYKRYVFIKGDVND